MKERTMNSQIATPLVQAVSEFMSSMVGVDCTIEPLADRVQSAAYVSGIITLTGNANGQVAVMFPREVGISLVAQLLGMNGSEVDEEILRDGIGEIANILAGSAKGKLSEVGFDLKLSLPSVVTGVCHHIDSFKSKLVGHYAITSLYGTYELGVWLALN